MNSQPIIVKGKPAYVVPSVYSGRDGRWWINDGAGHHLRKNREWSLTSMRDEDYWENEDSARLFMELCADAPPAAPASEPTGELPQLNRYDAGLLGSGGGGDVGWWHDYLRVELDRAHEFYVSQVVGWTQLLPANAERGELPQAIMNIPCDGKEQGAYKRGHRDARHAAAEGAGNG